MIFELKKLMAVSPLKKAVKEMISESSKSIDRMTVGNSSSREKVVRAVKALTGGDVHVARKSNESSKRSGRHCICI